MKTQDIEIAIASHLGWRRNLVVPNVFWGLNFRHELDLAVLTKSGCIWEVEIKVSLSDLKKDKEKRHCHVDIYNRISRLYFAIPEKLESHSEHIPGSAGILVARRRNNKIFIDEIRKAKRNTSATKLTEKEISKLYHLAAMRIWPLKKKLNKRFLLK